MFQDILRIMDRKPSDNSKTEQLTKARTGSIESFEEILFAYEKRIFNYIFSIVRHKQDTEDLTQETFIKVFKNLKLIDPALNFEAWLFRIATNTTYDWFRKKGSRPELFVIDDLESKFETIDEDSSYIKLETAKDIKDALDGLKPVYRVVLLLFYWRGFSYKEISSILSLPLNTVKTLLRRGKKALKEALVGKPS